MPTLTGWLGVAVQLLVTLAELAAPRPWSLYISVGGLTLCSVILFGMFASILWKGVGTRRTLPDVLINSFLGTLSFPIHFGVIYTAADGLISANGSDVTDICTGIYFSIVTWTTLGYGDIIPVKMGRLVAASEALLGYILMALLIATIARALDRVR